MMMACRGSQVEIYEANLGQAALFINFDEKNFSRFI